MKIYLDVCCLNRPFDDQSQDRIRLEAEAVLLILSHIQNEAWVWHSSDVVVDEIDQTPDTRRRERVRQLHAHAQAVYQLTAADIVRAKALINLGFANVDALHLACAEKSGADIFLTTDDKLLRRANRLAENLHVAVENPLPWLVRQQESDA